MSEDIGALTEESWTESSLFKNSFDSTMFLEKLSNDTPSINQSLIKTPEDASFQSLPNLDVPLKNIDMHFVNISRKFIDIDAETGINLYSQKLLDLIRGVYKDKHGVRHTLQEKSNLYSIVYEISKNDVNACIDQIIGYYNIDKNSKKGRRVKDLFRDELRHKFASDISYVFSVSSLLRGNPFRGEQGKKRLADYCNGRTKHYISPILIHLHKAEVRSENHLGKTYKGEFIKDRSSKTKPPQSFNYSVVRDLNTTDFDNFQERNIFLDITNFKANQGYWNFGYRNRTSDQRAISSRF